METEILYARIRSNLRQAVHEEAKKQRRKIAAQVEVIIEDWLDRRDLGRTSVAAEARARAAK